MTDDRMPRWTQYHDDRAYLVIVTMTGDPGTWVSALNYTAYEGLEWTLRKSNWLVGCEPGLCRMCPDFADVDRPLGTYVDAASD